MIHAGIGVQQVNNFLTTINMPGITSKGLKALENEVGQAIEKVASESAQKWLDEEKRLAI